MQFSDITGHEQIIAHLQNAIANGKVSHAYIFDGPRQSGKGMLAAAFAQALLCEEHGTDGCGRCRSCRQAESGSHPDIIRVTHEKPNTIAVSDIREQINGTIFTKPYNLSSRFKIYIIDEAEKMNEQAQNALLKTLEEPPAHAVILLLSANASSFLPTIRSRCVTLSLRPVADTEIRALLMRKYQIVDYRADLCTAFAQGNVGKAVSLAGSASFNELKERTIRFLREIRNAGPSELKESIREILDFEMQDDFLDLVLFWFRDILCFKAAGRQARLLFSDQAAEIREESEALSWEGIGSIFDAFEEVRRQLRENVSAPLALELFALTIRAAY